MPVLTVVAGANGSGKSTLTKLSGVNILLIDRSLANLSKAAKIVDRLILYDNSTNAGHQLIATVEEDRSVIYAQELPGWIERSNLNLRSSD